MSEGLDAVCVVVTTYRPDPGFASRFADLATACKAVLVVDNTPGGHRFDPLPEGMIVLQDGRNKGLGPALNAGLDRAVELGGAHAVLFDQDSHPTIAVVASLLGDARRAGDRTVVGPVHVDDVTGRRTSTRQHASATSLRQTGCLPTSGMLLPLAGWPDGPRFDETLFLDLVDFDWCWKRGAEGWRFFESASACMPHRLGLGQRRLFGITFHVPAPYRHYFQFRDTLRVALRRHVPMYSRLRLLGILPLKLIAYPWLMDRGAERLGWMLRGIADRWRGKVGAGAAAATIGA